MFSFNLPENIREPNISYPRYVHTYVYDISGG